VYLVGKGVGSLSKQVRVSDEIFALIQNDAQPIVDTVDSVLRRWAEKLGKIEVPEASSNDNQKEEDKMKAIENYRYSANQLNRDFDVGAAQCRYHKDGHFFEKLTRFPGALFDADGYVVFTTRQNYQQSKYLNIGRKLNVPGGIAKLPGYKKYPKPLK